MPSSETRRALSPSAPDTLCGNAPASLLIAIASIILGISWLFPLTAGGALLAWASTLLFATALRNGGHGYRSLYLGGMLSITIGFYWLFWTIKDFGFFGYLPAFLIFGLFVAVGALQFCLFLYAFRALPRALDSFALRLPAAWIFAECLSFRIFPWQYGHTQSGILSLAQLADIAGVTTISFLMFWFADGFSLVMRTRRIRPGVLPLCALIASLAYGHFQLSHLSFATAPTITVGIAQGNIPLAMKHDPKSIIRNIREYEEISQPLLQPQTLVVWPETAIMAWVSNTVGNISADRRLPAPRNGAAYLIGSLSYASETLIYNSAFAITPNGDVPAPYHKQVLMPFGEYTPLGKYFPWIRAMNSTAADFTPGDAATVLKIPLMEGSVVTREVNAAPLICYEDVIVGPSRDATENGADLLVNITNDLWFGKTAAPLQHHQIALFRAIENRRFLIRATNSGFSAVVDPFGRTVSQLPPFERGTLLAKVNLISYKTLYTSTLGERPWWGVVGILALMILGRCWTTRSVHGTAL